MSTVIVVDDQERMRTMLCRLLASDGHVVHEEPDGASALRWLADHDADLMLLDLVMPEVGGLQVLHRLRERGLHLPVIVLSAVSDVSARVESLGLGAVDFVGKPFHSAELLARVRRTLTLGATPSYDQRYLEHSGLRLDLDRRRATWRGQAVTLTARESELLAHLMRRADQVCGRAELLHDVWDLDFEPSTNLVEACIRRIRHKLPEVPIETVRSIGYCFGEG